MKYFAVNMKYCYYHHYIFLFFRMVKYIFWHAGWLDDPPVQPGRAGRDADHRLQQLRQVHQRLLRRVLRSEHVTRPLQPSRGQLEQTLRDLWLPRAWRSMYGEGPLRRVQGSNALPAGFNLSLNFFCKMFLYKLLSCSASRTRVTLLL